MNLRVRDAAARLGVSEGYLYKLIREGRLRVEPMRVGLFQEVHSIPELEIEKLLVRGGDAA